MSGPPPTNCALQTSCSTCVPLVACGWCPETSTCASGSAAGPQMGSCANWMWDTAVCSNSTVAVALSVALFVVAASILIFVIVRYNGFCREKWARIRCCVSAKVARDERIQRRAEELLEYEEAAMRVMAFDRDLRARQFSSPGFRNSVIMDLPPQELRARSFNREDFVQYPVPAVIPGLMTRNDDGQLDLEMAARDKAIREAAAWASRDHLDYYATSRSTGSKDPVVMLTQAPSYALPGAREPPRRPTPLLGFDDGVPRPVSPLPSPPGAEAKKQLSNRMLVTDRSALVSSSGLSLSAVVPDPVSTASSGSSLSAASGMLRAAAIAAAARGLSDSPLPPRPIATARIATPSSPPHVGVSGVGAGVVALSTAAASSGITSSAPAVAATSATTATATTSTPSPPRTAHVQRLATPAALTRSALKSSSASLALPPLAQLAAAQQHERVRSRTGSSNSHSSTSTSLSAGSAVSGSRSIDGHSLTDDRSAAGGERAQELLYDSGAGVGEIERPGSLGVVGLVA